MRKVGIEAFEDPARPAGGFAVVALRGISSLADARAFLLRPADGSEGEPGYEAWPTGPHTPVDARLTADGLELVVGPNLTGDAALLPGTAVTIELVGADVGGEFLWPDVAPPARPRRTTVIAARAIRAPAPLNAAAATPAVIAGGDVQSNHDNNDDNDDDDRAPAFNPQEHAPEPYPVIRPAARLSARMSAPVLQSGDDIEQQRAPAFAISVRNLLPASRVGRAAAAVGCLFALEALAYAVLAPTAPRVANGMTAAPSAREALYNALKPADVSPRGQDARLVDAEKALDNANASLFASASRDTGEAAFWLRRFLATTLGDVGRRSLFTELGTTFASPSRGAPDYATAHELWQVAASFGDGQAMCRIADLYDAAAGGPRDPAEAAKWRARAADVGGCATR